MYTYTYIVTLRFIASKPTKVIKWNHKKYSKNKAEKEEKGNKDRQDKKKTDSRLYLKSNHNNSHDK